MSLTIDRLLRLIQSEYRSNGFDFYFGGDTSQIAIRVKSDLAEVGLIHTEVSEAQEAIRTNNGELLGLELADIIIRTMNFAGRKGIDMDCALRTKISMNENRPVKHGRVNI